MTKFATESAMSPELLASTSSHRLGSPRPAPHQNQDFCGCSTRFGDPPNSNVCPVCLASPARCPFSTNAPSKWLCAAAAGHQLHCHEHSRFARKNYFYPDLPKGYQISQYELPWPPAAGSKSKSTVKKSASASRACILKKMRQIPSRRLSTFLRENLRGFQPLRHTAQ